MRVTQCPVDGPPDLLGGFAIAPVSCLKRFHEGRLGTATRLDQRRAKGGIGRGFAADRYAGACLASALPRVYNSLLLSRRLAESENKHGPRPKT